MKKTLYSVCEVPLFSGNVDDASKLILDTAKSGEGAYVCAVNTHSVVCSKENNLLENSLNSSLINTADGMPLYWISKLCKLDGISHITGSDLLINLLVCSEQKGIPVYFYGCEEDTLGLIRERLEKEHPKLKIAGMEAPGEITIPPQIDHNLTKRLAQSKAKIVFVGLGCPKQEIWMNLHAQETGCVFIGIGAAFDFYAGIKQRSPEWMTEAGLEWLHRMASEPRRLLKRYFVNSSYC